MKTERITAFADDVVAIIVTIMVLELKVPESAELHALLATLPIVATYAPSYINVGLFWNNHHHLLQSVQHIDGRALSEPDASHLAEPRPLRDPLDVAL